VSFNLLAEVYDWAGSFVKDYVLTHYGPSTSVLDVGAGRGKYRMLLPTYASVDACEVWEPTVDREGLRDLYRDVFVCDVVELVQLPSWNESRYDLVIMGDVLEHLALEDATFVVDRVADVGADVIVVVPYVYPQDEEDGNAYQRHLQDDLTPESMVATYPQLRLIALETRDFKPFKGIYVGRAE